MQPLISIITPVYNRADCVVKCLESVSTQKCDVLFEHIVVDDCSTDNTFDLVKEYAAKHQNIKTLRLEVNSGPNAARNAAVSLARGKFMLMLDSDDELAPDSLQFVADTIGNYPQYREFLFAIDGQADYLVSKGFEKDDTCEVTSLQWIADKFPGDYAHVVSRDVMLKHPFDEKLRIHEGIFYDLFFKEVGVVLFVNHTVLLVDSCRDDHVSFTLISDNKESMLRSVEAYRLMMKLLYTDYTATDDGRQLVIKELLQYYKKSVMLGLDDDAAYCETKLYELSSAPSVLYKTLRKLKAGSLFFSLGRYYIKLKYKLWQGVK